jgi:DNA-binding response OmpR family regulator
LWSGWLTSEHNINWRGHDSPQPIRLRGVTLDGRRRLLTYRGEQAELTMRETELLAYLMRHPDQYFSAEELVRMAWQAARLSPEELRIYVHRLRGKVAPLGLPFKLIGRQWLGYRLEVKPSGASRLWAPVRDPLLMAYRWLQRGGRRRSAGS